MVQRQVTAARLSRSNLSTATPVAGPSTSSTPYDGTPGDSPEPSEDVESLISQVNYAEAPRPFKNPAYGKTTSNRRPKTAKQIIQIERERYAKPKKKTGRPAASQVATAATTPVDGMDVDEETAANQTLPDDNDEVVRKEQYIAYHEYEAPPSLKPAKKYCDVTGLEAPYTDPKSKLRYHNAQIYDLLKTFTSGAEQEYLSLRGQSTQIR